VPALITARRRLASKSDPRSSGPSGAARGGGLVLSGLNRLLKRRRPCSVDARSRIYDLRNANTTCCGINAWRGEKDWASRLACFDIRDPAPVETDAGRNYLFCEYVNLMRAVVSKLHAAAP
jgi:hypothetical protein